MVEEKKTTSERIMHSVSWFIPVLIAWIVVSIFMYHGEFVLTIAWIAVLIGLPLIVFLLPGRHKLCLCKERIYMKSGIRSWLYPWDSFRYFTANETKKGLS